MVISTLHPTLMKRTFCLHVMFLLAINAYAQRKPTALDTLIQTENDFAKMAADVSMKQAFLQYLDSSGLVFEHAIPANGMEVYSKAPENKDMLLAWHPAVAAVSGDGTLGFTSGPFQFSMTHTTAPFIYGNYFTVWKKDAQGQFKLKADGGTAYGKDAPPQAVGKLTDAHTLYSSAHTAPAHASFKKASEEFTTLVNKDVVKAYTTYLADTPYLLRARSLPAHDRNAALQLAIASPYSNASVTDQEVAGSNDLAFSYGQLLTRPENANTPVKTFFLRIWIYENNSWKILAEVVNMPKTQ